jgi:hypothetical protein
VIHQNLRGTFEPVRPRRNFISLLGGAAAAWAARGAGAAAEQRGHAQVNDFGRQCRQSVVRDFFAARHAIG